MAENRNASAHEVNDDTLDGESVAGVGRAMGAPYPWGVTGGPGAAGRYPPLVPDDVADLLAANEAFYAAFEAGDIDAMSGLWRHEDHVVCTHPGWPSLRGWAAVGASWFALFQPDVRMQFILTNVVARVVGDVGWVSLDENLIVGPQAQTVAALNLFERVDGRWLLVVHQGSGISVS